MNYLLRGVEVCWNYVTFQRGTRLIIGISDSCIEDVVPALSTAPALAVGTGDPGSVEAVQTLRHADLARQNGLQHAWVLFVLENHSGAL